MLVCKAKETSSSEKQLLTNSSISFKHTQSIKSSVREKNEWAQIASTNIIFVDNTPEQSVKWILKTQDKKTTSGLRLLCCANVSQRLIRQVNIPLALQQTRGLVNLGRKSVECHQAMSCAVLVGKEICK